MPHFANSPFTITRAAISHETSAGGVNHLGFSIGLNAKGQVGAVRHDTTLAAAVYERPTDLLVWLIWPASMKRIVNSKATKRLRTKGRDMKAKWILAAAAMCINGQAIAQENSKAGQNKAAMRRLFPILSVLDKHRPATAQNDATPAAASAEAAGVAGPDDFGTSPAMAARMRQMDVAGIRLGMGPEDVKAALRTRGYAPTPDTMYTDRRPWTQAGYDYATRVEEARRQRLSDFKTPMKFANVVTAEAWNKADESVRVEYAVGRSGRRVSQVSYNIPEGRMAWAAMRDNIVEKYGRPTRLSENLNEIHYCGDAQCAPLVNGNQAALDLTGRWNLQLTDQGAANRAAAREIAADAEKSITKTSKPSF